MSRMCSKQRRASRMFLLTRDPNICVWCGTKLAIRRDVTNTASLEHIVPRSEGGKNHRDNLVLACVRCNIERQSKPIIVWMAMRRQKQNLVENRG